jgi:crossover junction endodeoxyribonuclease RuvC
MPIGSGPQERGRGNAERFIVGVDPGLASTGYGVIAVRGNRCRYLTHGCIETSKDLEIGDRLSLIYDEFITVIDEYGPTEAGMEGLYFSKNITSALWVAEAKGVVTLALKQRGIALAEYTPFAIKNAIVGNGRAEKKQVQEMVKLLLGLKEIPKPDHAADALAVAVCHFHWAAIPLATLPKR